MFSCDYYFASADTLTLSKNTISLAAGAPSGITLTGLAAGAGGFAVSGNTVTGISGATGIAVTRSAGTGAIALSGNTVNGAGTGIRFDGVAAGNSTTDTVSGNGVGLLVTLTGTTTVSGLTATGNTTGVSVTGNILALASGTLPTAGLTGRSVSGGTASVTGGTFARADTGVDFTGGCGSLGGFTFNQAAPNTTDLRVAAGLTLGNTLAFAGTRLFLDNQSATAYDLSALTGVSYYSQAATAPLFVATKADAYRIKDRVFHILDGSTSGLVTVVAGNVYVTDLAVANPAGVATTDSFIQGGGYAVPTGNGWTVNIDQVSYVDGVTLGSKSSLTILGAGSGSDADDDGKSRKVGDATIESIVPVAGGFAFTTGTAVGTTVRGFDIDATGGNGINDTGCTATLSRNFVHGGVYGVSIATAGTTVTRSTITGTFRGVMLQAANATISENVITGNTAGIEFATKFSTGIRVTNVTVSAGGTVSPGDKGSVGLLTVTRAAALAGTGLADLGVSQAGSDRSPPRGTP